MVFSLGNNLLLWFQGGEMFHKYFTCPLQISPQTHVPCGELKSVRNALVFTKPIILLPSSPASWAWQSNSHSEEIFSILIYKINLTGLVLE